MTKLPYMTERAVEYGGVRTRELVVAGRTPPVLLLHGFADSADTWRPVLERFHRIGQSAVAVDLPGFGHADPLRPGAVMPQLDEFTADVAARLGSTQPIVVAGNSLGGAIAIRAAQRKNPCVGKVLAIDAAGHGWTRLTASVGTVSWTLTALSYMSLPQRLHRKLIRWVLARLLYGERAAVDTEVVAAFADTIADSATLRRLLVVGAQFVGELDRDMEHGGVDVPMTVLHGAKDHLVPVSASRAIHKANPGSRLVVLPRIGHCPQLDAPDTVVTHARKLLNCVPEEKEIS